MVILVTDGRATLAEGSAGYPTTSAAIHALTSLGMRVYVIGFALTNEDASILKDLDPDNGGPADDVFIVAAAQDLATAIGEVFDEVLPEGAGDALRAALRDIDRRLPGYAGEHGMLVGPESRSSAPLRLLRDTDSMESISHPGLIPVGEGAGHAGGIMSAAVDGLRAAEAIARRWRAEAVPSALTWETTESR